MFDLQIYLMKATIYPSDKQQFHGKLVLQNFRQIHLKGQADLDNWSYTVHEKMFWSHAVVNRFKCVSLFITLLHTQ
jgi:hypothetical protein